MKIQIKIISCFKNLDRSHENGVSLLLGTFFIFILAGLAALGIGLGFVASGKSRIQNITNLVSLSALEIISKQGSNLNVAARANQIASANRVPGMSPMGDIQERSHALPSGGSGGSIEYGNWYFSDPDGIGASAPLDPCGVGNYPCFVASAEYNPQVNSVRVTVQNQASNNPILTPFAGFFGYDGGYVTSKSTAVLAGQCSILLQDVSLSTTYDTHKNPNLPTSVEANPAYFVYPASVYPCSSLTEHFENNYCALEAARAAGSTVDPTIHYQLDYQPRGAVSGAGAVGEGQILVDTFVDTNSPTVFEGPEPLRTFFLASNSALRNMFEGSAGSFWAGIGFENGVSNVSPTSRWVPSGGFATNPGSLVQATNLDNRGTTDENGSDVSPLVTSNFLNYGWFPHIWINSPNVDGRTEVSNIVEAFEVAIAQFQSTTILSTCPATYRKTIILSTDGVGNCWKTGGTPSYQCQDDIVGYNNYINQLLNTVSGELQRKNISVVVLFGGQYVGAHFINRDATASGYQTETGSNFFGFQEALVNGYGAFAETDPLRKIIDESPEISDPAEYNNWCNSSANCHTAADCTTLICRNRYAMERMGSIDTTGAASVKFRQPAAVLAQLAIDTKGIFCPLLPLDPNPSHYVDHDFDPSTPKVLDDAFREENGRQEFAITELTPAEQGVLCISKNWKNRFILVEEEG